VAISLTLNLNGSATTSVSIGSIVALNRVATDVDA
jgi:hypothetical protein